MLLEKLRDITARRRNHSSAAITARCNDWKLSWRFTLFSECVCVFVFFFFCRPRSHSGMAKRFEIERKKPQKTLNSDSFIPWLLGIFLYIFHTSAQSSWSQLRNCSYYRHTLECDSPEGVPLWRWTVHSGVITGNRERGREGGVRRSEILWKIVSLDTRSWLRLVHSDLKKKKEKKKNSHMFCVYLFHLSTFPSSKILTKWQKYALK